MLFALLAAALLPATALAAISINGPSETAFWVQNTSNTISWSFASGDPNPISIVVTNSNDTFLNGNFSIAEFVDLSLKTFTVTNVTLKAADGYSVDFVNPTNHSQVYATSGTFPVKVSGTAPPSVPVTNNSNTPSSSTSASSSFSAPFSASTMTFGGADNNTPSAALPAFGSHAGVFGMVAAAGVVTFSALLL